MKIEKLITHLYRYALRSGENHSVIVNNKNDIKIIKSNKELSPSVNIIVGGNLCVAISPIEILKVDYFDTNDIGFYIVIAKLEKSRDQVSILYQNGKKLIYNVPISKKPYTALCVDIFTEEENENGIVVTKYINDAGLRGTYSVYVQINDQIYKTKASVQFS